MWNANSCFNALSTFFPGNFSIERGRETSRHSWVSKCEGSGTNQKVFCVFLQSLVVLLICSINFLERSCHLGPHDNLPCLYRWFTWCIRQPGPYRNFVTMGVNTGAFKNGAVERLIILQGIQIRLKKCCPWLYFFDLFILVLFSWFYSNYFQVLLFSNIISAANPPIWKNGGVCQVSFFPHGFTMFYNRINQRLARPLWHTTKKVELVSGPRYSDAETKSGATQKGTPWMDMNRP